MILRALAILLALSGPVAGQGAQLCRPDPVAIPALNTCSGRDRVSVAVVGDVLLHGALQRQGHRFGFATLWSGAVPYLRAADIAIANLEGPVAPGLARGGRRVADPGPVFDGVVYTEYPLFNYHPAAIDALIEAGFDAVTTANNHAMDRGPAGVSATLDELDRRGIARTGTRHAGAPRDFAVRLPTALGSLSLIGCSYDTNGIPDPQRQVLLCYRDRAELLALVRAEAARPGGAGVIVLPHWGVEYSHEPQDRQRALARDLVVAGAMAVVGSHPHVVQPWEVLETPRGRAPVVYSTGNFVAGQIELARATGQMAWLELCRTSQGVAVGAAGYLPLLMTFDRGIVLTVPGPEDGGGAPGARALLERVVPGRDLSRALACSRAVAPRATTSARSSPDANWER